ncbi:hypothetical protein Tcan_18473 [Toxocara canis]|uniref:Uncharacterized protein n=1 Tax=Toxocara canis TaxID=6265 RepID=A0A0B2VBG8_TOXCA|nr:hypothetical protein Tcan_18473 [Toxocara canis]
MDSNNRSTCEKLHSEVTEKRRRRRREGVEQSERSARRKVAGNDKNDDDGINGLQEMDMKLLTPYN